MENAVLNILLEICGDEESLQDKDINLFDSGLIDSLGVIELLLKIEDELNIRIQPTEVTREDIATPNKIIEFLSKRN